jgi:hypothetical protein
MIGVMASAGETLELAGKCILMRTPLAEVGGKLVDCGTVLLTLSSQIAELAPEHSDGQVSSQRMAYASEKMIQAGNELIKGTPQSKPNKGKGWLKQG